MTHFLSAIQKDKLYLLVILLVGLALRLDFLFANSFIIDADEAIVGLMAKHITEGQNIPIFYYGQDYMGSFEGLIASLAFKVFGSNIFALKCVPLVFSLLFITLMFVIGFEIGGVFVGRVSALLSAVAPSTLIIWSGKARGGFIELICIGAIATIFTLQWLKSEDRSLYRIFFIGLLLGFGWWVNNQIIFFMLPIGFVIFGRLLYKAAPLAAKLVKMIVSFILGVAAFFVGGLPFWLYNLKEDFVSFQMFQSSDSVDVLGQLGGVFTTALPILFGAKRFWQTSDTFLFSTPLIWIVYLLLVIMLLHNRRKQVFGLLCLKIDASFGVELLMLFVFATLCVFSLSSFGYLVEAPRYLLPLYCALFPLTAFVIHRIKQKAPFLAYGCICGLLVINLCSSYLGGRAIPGEPFVFKGERVSKDHSDLINWLDSRDYSWVRTNYWIGYRLAFETNERIRFLIVQKPYQRRIESYHEEGLTYGIEKMPYVLVPAQAAIIEMALQALGYSYAVADMSGYRVLYDIVPKNSDLVPYEVGEYTLATTVNSTFAANAHDGRSATRWGSAKPQRPGMELTVSFKTPTSVRALRYEMGEWIHDYPRELRVDAVLATGEIVEIVSPMQYRAIRYLVEYDSAWSLYFNTTEAKEIKFTQLGSHSVFDWSVAELQLYR